MAILSKGCKPDIFESGNSLKLSFTNVDGLLLTVNLSLNQTLQTFLLCVRQTQITQLILAISLIWKDSITHMHGLLVYAEEELPFAWDLSLENSDSYLCFQLALLHSVPYFFFLYWSPLSLCTVFDSISFNIDGVLSINLSASMFFFGDFNIHQWTG